MEYSSHKDLTGTVRYASLNAHLGIAQSRRDDLESLGFLFVYFLKGCLPWQGLKADTKKKKYEKVLKLKIETSIDSLTKGTPEELKKYLSYCRELRFEQKPGQSTPQSTHLHRSVYLITPCVLRRAQIIHTFDVCSPIYTLAANFQTTISLIGR